MKQCGYCAKEIGYNDMFCSSECETLSNSHYTVRAKFQKLISALNILGTCAIGIGIFVYALANFVGTVLIVGGAAVTGLLTLIIPTPPDNFTKKYKLKKAVFLTRIFGLVLIVFSVVMLFLFI